MSFSKGPVRCGPAEARVGVCLGAGDWEWEGDKGQRERASQGTASSLASPSVPPWPARGHLCARWLGAAWSGEEK